MIREDLRAKAHRIDKLAGNEYVLRHTDEIWVGDIPPNGMLSSMLSRLGLSAI